MIKAIEKFMKGTCKMYLYILGIPFIIVGIIFLFCLDAMFASVKKRK